MNKARMTAKCRGAHTCVLEWSLDESPRWVAWWYARLGYDEKDFSDTYALMKLPIKDAKK